MRNKSQRICKGSSNCQIKILKDDHNTRTSEKLSKTITLTNENCGKSPETKFIKILTDSMRNQMMPRKNTSKLC